MTLFMNVTSRFNSNEHTAYAIFCMFVEIKILLSQSNGKSYLQSYERVQRNALGNLHDRSKGC